MRIWICNNASNSFICLFWSSFKWHIIWESRYLTINHFSILMSIPFVFTLVNFICTAQKLGTGTGTYSLLNPQELNKLGYWLNICSKVRNWTLFLARLMVEGELSSICCLVVDELHLLGDPSRGYLLELLLTKVPTVLWYLPSVPGPRYLPWIQCCGPGTSVADPDSFFTDSDPGIFFQSGSRIRIQAKKHKFFQ